MTNRRTILSLQMFTSLSAAATVFFAAAAIVGCKEYPIDTSATQAEVAPATASVIHFRVDGLHCHGCAASVRNTISRIDGVRRCNVSFEGGSAEVVFDVDEQDAAIAKIVEEVVDLGFTIERRDS